MSAYGIITRLNDLLGKLSSWIYALLFLIILFEVVMRYVLSSPTVWVFEITIALAGIQYAIGGAYAMARKEHVRIDVIYDLFDVRIQRFLDIVCSLIILCVLGVIIYWGVLQAQSAMTPTWQTTGGAWNSHAPVYMKIAIPLAGVLMFAQALAELVEQVKMVAR